MTRRRIRSLSFLTAVPLLALGLTACSFSFKAGSKSADDATARPAPTSDDDASATAPKPVATADPEPAEPTRVPPAVADQPEPTVEPRITAVCRVQDEGLASLCHRAFDPIAANDMDRWIANLADDVVVTRPSHDETMHRIQGTEQLREVATDLGGVRALMHLNDTDRVVGTVSNDCRQCRRAFVGFQANTRSGTVVVNMDTSQPPRVVGIEVTSRVRRPRLGEARPGGKAPVTIPLAPPAEQTGPTLSDKPAATDDSPTLSDKPAAKKKAPTTLEVKR